MGQTPTAMRGPRGIYPGAPDPNISNRYDPFRARHIKINEAIQPPEKELIPYEQNFAPKETPEKYFLNVYEYLCKTAQDIDPELLRVEDLILKLEEHPLVLYTRYPNLTKRRALEVDFYGFAKLNYGTNWDRLPRRKLLVQYICQLLQNEFMIIDNQPVVAIESMFTLIPHDIVARIMEYNRPTEISIGGKKFRVNTPPQLNKRIAAIYDELVLKPAMKVRVINVALSASLMVADVSGYYTSLYNRNIGATNFHANGLTFVGKFTDKDDRYNLKPFDSREFCLFYRSNARDTLHSIYSYGIKIIPDPPYHIDEESEGKNKIPHKIPLGFKIQQINVLNVTGTNEDGTVVPLIERYPSFFIDDKDPIYKKKEIEIDISEHITGVDLGFFLGYLTCIMSVIDSNSKIQFRAFLEQDPLDNKTNLIYREVLTVNRPFIRTYDELEKVRSNNDPKTLIQTMAAPYLTMPFKAANSSFAEAMIYMGLPIANRVRDNLSMIWDVSATLKYFVLFPEKYVKYWAVINNIERHRSFSEMTGYNVEPAFLWTFKTFVEDSSNTDLVKRILKDFFYVGIGSDIVEKSIEEFKRVLSLNIK